MKRISEKQRIPLISSGDALRDEIANGTVIGRKFQELIAKGLLVPDEVMFEFIDNLLSKYDLSEGFIFNGFPRTIPQAEFIDCYLKKRNIEIDKVVYLNVLDEEILRRISGRRTCKIVVLYLTYTIQNQILMESATTVEESYSNERTILKNQF